MKVYRRVMVTRYGFAQVPAETDEQALEAVRELRVSDFDWGSLDTDDAEVVDVLDEHGNTVSA